MPTSTSTHRMAGLVLTGGREDPGLTGSPTPAATLAGAQISIKQKRVILFVIGTDIFLYPGHTFVEVGWVYSKEGPD